MNQTLKDIVLLTECAKILGTLAETRHAPDSAVRLGQGLLDMAKRLRDTKIKKTITVDYGGPRQYTREEFINSAVHRESQEMMQDPEIYSEAHKQKLRDVAAKQWDETK